MFVDNSQIWYDLWYYLNFSENSNNIKTKENNMIIAFYKYYLSLRIQGREKLWFFSIIYIIVIFGVRTYHKWECELRNENE